MRINMNVQYSASKQRIFEFKFKFELVYLTEQLNEIYSNKF